jgi:hypothetical protein
MCVCSRGRERECGCTCVAERVCVNVCACSRGRERESVCMCACVYVVERVCEWLDVTADSPPTYFIHTHTGEARRGQQHAGTARGDPGMYECVCMSVCVYECMCVYGCMYVYVCVCVCVCMSVCVCMGACVCVLNKKRLTIHAMYKRIHTHRAKSALTTTSSSSSSTRRRTVNPRLPRVWAAQS